MPTESNRTTQAESPYASLGSEDTQHDDAAHPIWNAVVAVLTPLASLRLTVALFVMAIFIVFAGTLAQTEKDIWQVVHDYFRMDLTSWDSAARSAFAWIDLRVFFPRSFFPGMEPIPWGYGFFFPSGWLIGLVLFANLMAAHLIRFQIQTSGTRLAAGIVILLASIGLAIVVIAAGQRQTAVQLQLFTDWPSLRITWLLIQCTAVGSIMLLGCHFIFNKRAGIVVLHLGMGLMMFGELLVGVAAVEGQMSITEGETVNFVMDSRTAELAVIDSSDPMVEDVVAIPQSRLLSKEVLSHENLPFDVELVDYMPNSERRMATPADKNPATAGIGLQQIAVLAPVVSGTDMSGGSNRAAAYVRLLKKGATEPLGVYLLSMDDWLRGRFEKIQVGDKSYAVALRYKHMYKPYSLYLDDVRQDVYMGTNTPKNYSSHLQLVDQSRNVKRDVKIWMNNPLRFAGETFYQSNFGRDDAAKLEYTGLQVVTNTGWRIPYVSCMIVSVGMLWQFSLTLNRYLKRRNTIRPEVNSAGSSGPQAARGKDTTKGSKAAKPREVAVLATQSSGLARVFPALMVIGSAVWLASAAYTPSPRVGEFDLDGFGRLPVMYEGRVKPMDTLARNSLRVISDRQDYRNADGKAQPAIRWLLDVITDAPAAEKHRVFRIQNLDLLETLGLERRQGFRYSIEEVLPKIDAFSAQVRQARVTKPDERDLYQQKVLELDQRFNQYILLREAFRPSPLRAESLGEDLAQDGQRRRQNEGSVMPLAVPPQTPDGKWQPYAYAVFDALALRLAAGQGLKASDPNPATVALVALLGSYGDSATDSAAFNRNLQAYREVLSKMQPSEWSPAKTDFEASFNHFSPLYYAMMLYLVAFVLGIFAWLGWAGPLTRACTWLVLFTFVVHTAGLIGRIYISGRPPVTNLYSSALFVGWAGVLMAMVFEYTSRRGIANVVGAWIGFGALLIGHLLTTAVPSFKGDSFTVLQAVLDTQFWLATHVTCITAGYSATFLAGQLGFWFFVLRGTLTRSLDATAAKETSRMIYGMTCFAMFFSFLGTVLGGLWADDSWGRFWGWDPKENGALIIVLWNAVVLHAYWGRMVGQRGLAVLAIMGNVVTAWSWFGVNELNVGLHTYGFTEGVLMILGLFVAVNLAAIALGLLPFSLWRSNLQATSAEIGR